MCVTRKLGRLGEQLRYHDLQGEPQSPLDSEVGPPTQKAGRRNGSRAKARKPSLRPTGKSAGRLGSGQTRAQMPQRRGRRAALSAAGRAMRVAGRCGSDPSGAMPPVIRACMRGVLWPGPLRARRLWQRRREVGSGAGPGNIVAGRERLRRGARDPPWLHRCARPLPPHTHQNLRQMPTTDHPRLIFSNESEIVAASAVSLSPSYSPLPLPTPLTEVTKSTRMASATVSHAAALSHIVAV